MTPYYADDWLTVYHGDSRSVMAEMPADSVHCVVTSPPYWGLRDYGIDSQLGLEATPEEFVANMVAVFREVRRVLRPDGTLWLNLGDSYASEHPRIAYGDQGDRGPGATEGDRISRSWAAWDLKSKQLVGMPWRVAFALQADGWYLRSDIIWAKPNPMPESVTDRPTKAHEYLFLLAKSPRYYFDAEAVRESSNGLWNSAAGFTANGKRGNGTGYDRAALNQFNGTGTHDDEDKAGRNIRSVWTIPTAPYPGAHFATFPPKLVEPCIKAGTSERGVCPECGAPWTRVVERTVENRRAIRAIANTDRNDSGASVNADRSFVTVGWQPSCRHDAEPVPAVVLDPFAGSGTTGMVAQSLSRRAVLIDLSMDYLGQLMERNRDIPLGLGA